MLEAEGLRSGLACARRPQWLADDAQPGHRQPLEQQTAADRAAYPITSGVGDFLGGMVGPGGAGALAGRALRAGAAGAGALQGGLAGLLTPGGDDHFWRDKVLGLVTGAGAGAAAGKVGNALASLAAPVLRPFVKTLMDEGIELTPGMMKGGVAKTVEDRATSIPITGDAIQAARRRAFEQLYRAAWTRALVPPGEAVPANIPMGRQAADYVGDRLGAAYQRILPSVTVSANPADPAFAQFIGDLSSAARDARVLLPDTQFDQFERFVRAQIEQKITNARAGRSTALPSTGSIRCWARKCADTRNHKNTTPGNWVTRWRRSRPRSATWWRPRTRHRPPT